MIPCIPAVHLAGMWDPTIMWDSQLIRHSYCQTHILAKLTAYRPPVGESNSHNSHPFGWYVRPNYYMRQTTYRTCLLSNSHNGQIDGILAPQFVSQIHITVIHLAGMWDLTIIWDSQLMRHVYCQTHILAKLTAYSLPVCKSNSHNSHPFGQYVRPDY